MRAAFISPIMDVNTGPYRTAVRNLATGVASKNTGYTEEGTTTTNPDLLAMLALSGVVPIVESVIWVGWHPLVAANVMDRYFDIQFFGLRQVGFNPPGPEWTEEHMIDMLKRFARQTATHFWLVRPGDSLATSSPDDLVSRFVEF